MGGGSGNGGREKADVMEDNREDNYQEYDGRFNYNRNLPRVSFKTIETFTSNIVNIVNIVTNKY